MAGTLLRVTPTGDAIAAPVRSRLQLMSIVLSVILSLVWAWLPASPAQAATSTLYLDGDGWPTAELSHSSPSATTLANYNPSGHDPGLELKETNKGWAESDPKRYQLWVADTAGITIAGTVTATIWGAAKDFAAGQELQLDAFLLDCNAPGTGCTLIDSASGHWSGSQSDAFTAKTLDFGGVSHTVSPGRALALKVVVDASASDRDMWLAYATTTYPAALNFASATAPTTTTTVTSTTTSLVTTTTHATSTTTIGVTTTTTRNGKPEKGDKPEKPGRPERPDPGSESTSTTLAVLAGGDPGSPGGGSGGSGPSSPVDPGLGSSNVDAGSDPSMTPIGAGESADLDQQSWPGGLIGGLQLVIPPWAASMVASPLLVLGFVFDAMTDSGRAVMLPLTLLLAGLAWVMFENRAFAFAWFRRDESESWTT